jgi:hypothetical protein
MLLEKDADVNAQGGEYLSALQAAVVRKRTDCTDVLHDSLDGGPPGNVCLVSHGRRNFILFCPSFAFEKKSNP